MKDLIDIDKIGLEIEGILSPVHHLGVTDVIWWHKGDAAQSVQRFTSTTLLCDEASNFRLNRDGFEIGDKV